MALTLAQLQTFKTAVLGEAALAAARAAGDHGAIAAYYNASAGTGSIWKPAVTDVEMNSVIVWADFVALTAIRQNGYIAMTQPKVVDATKATIRAGFTAVFGAGTTSLTNLTALAQRVPTRFEALYTTANVCPLFGYAATVADVAEALAS